MVDKLIFSQRPNFIYGLILLIIGFAGLSFILGSWYLERIELRQTELRQLEVDKRVAWEKYFAVDLTVPLDQIKALPLEDHVIVAGVDFTLHSAVQNVQNSAFDSLSIDEVGRVAFINVFIPKNLKPADLERFMFFQALNYSTIIKKLYPHIDLSSIGIRVFSRDGALNGFMGYNKFYDFNKMLKLIRFGYSQAYSLEESGNKKATTR